MKHSVLVKTVLMAAAIPLLAGCVEREVVYSAPPPPPAQVEVIPVAPDRSFVWISGNWEWRGAWVWVGGRWTPRPYPGAVWIPGHWAWRHHRQVWVGGRWG